MASTPGRAFKGRQIFMETLLAEGVEYVFGNPGTTESPLLDALLDYPQIRYIVSLQEAVAVSMADAYAHASGKVGIVNLHVAPGLGNGLGSLYNAWEGRTPLIVTAGQQDTRMRLRDPLLGHNLVAMAAPLVKWSVQAESADELPLLLNRAFKVARDEPSGPVFVALPINVMEQETRNPPMAPARLFARAAPDPAGVDEAAALLVSARQPVIVCGDGVARSGAMAELVALAEQTGAPVWGDVLPGRLAFPTGHPNFRDRLPGDHALIRQSLGGADTVLLVAGEFFEEVWHTAGSPFPDGAAIIQVDAAPSQLARNFPVTVGLVADPKAALAALSAAVAAKATGAFRARVQSAQAALARLKAQEWEKQKARSEKGAEGKPMAPARLMLEIRDALPKDAIIVQESITATADLYRTIPVSDATGFYGPRGGGIGQGLPSAIGVKVAHPNRPVLAISGDGSSLYTIQALWSAAHHRLPVVFVILNNKAYRILKINMNRYRRDFGLGGERPHPHMDLTDPDLGYVDIAKGFGVPGRTVSDPAEVGPALKAAFASGKPYLLDILVDGAV
jgi:benzoylformate decarboxylase